MIETSSLKTIVMVLFGLTIVWLAKILIKQESETLVRALLTAVFFGGILLFLQQTKLQTISLKNMREVVFPVKDQIPDYVKDEGRRGTVNFVRYTFPTPTGQEGTLLGIGPRLKLTLDPSGRYYHVIDVAPINRVLDHLGLPKVESGVKELASITGKLSDVNYYRWDNYDGRTLIIERGLCQNIDGLERYHCIVSITIQTES
jgi:hypothetical protein